MDNMEILEHLKEYLQLLLDSGTHKIFYNDLFSDEKTIDCINAINDLIEENQKLKKQKNDVVEYIKKNKKVITKYEAKDTGLPIGTFMWNIDEVLRMLGEIE